MHATPNALTTREIERESAVDEELVKVRKAVETGNFNDCKAYAPIANEICVIGQFVLRGVRIVMPSKLRARCVALAHEGHLGIVGTKQNLRTKVWWPGVDKAAERFCKSCHGCQLTARVDPPEPLKTTPLPDGPWVDVAVDLMGPLPSGENLLVVVDYFSRYYEVEIMRSTTTDKVIDRLENIFTTHGYPVNLKTDNGHQFKEENVEFTNYCRENNINHVFSIEKWAQANGEVERQNQSILKRLQIAHAEKRDLKVGLRKYLRAYRSIPHSTTGRSPNQLLFGRELKGKIPVFSAHKPVDQAVKDHDSMQKGKGKIYADERRNARPSDKSVGDTVLLKQEKHNKLDTNFSPVPHTVVHKNGSKLSVESPEGVVYNRNSAHTHKYVDDNVIDVDKHVTFADDLIDIPCDNIDDTVDNFTDTRDDSNLNDSGGRPKRSVKPPDRLNL